MEMLKEVVIDFILFSGIEGFLYAMFFNKVCKCKKLNIFEIFIMSVGNCLLSCFVPPLLYQLLMMVWMAIYMYFIEKRKKTILKYIEYSSLMLFGQLIIEMLFAMFYEFILNIDLFEYAKFNLFVVMIPIRVIQLLIIVIIGGFNMKGWLGGVVRK